MLRSLIVVGVLFGMAGLVLAQDVTSGPAAGDKVPALKVYDVTGARKEKEVDYAADRKDKPTVYYLIPIDKFDRPMNRFMKEMDTAMKKDFPDAYAVAVFVGEDADAIKKRLGAIQQSVQYEVTALTVFEGDKAGPKEWNVNGDARITVVVANKQKVTAPFGYQSINETDVKAVREALKNALDKK